MFDRQTAEERSSQLLRRIAARDREALAEFYDLMSGILFSTVIRILGDVNESEEVVQDVFLQVWKSAATFDSALGTPFNWVLGITRNRAIDRLRARQRRFRAMDTLESFAEVPPAWHAAPAQMLFSEEERAGVRAALNTIPSDQRQAIEMAFFGGMTHAEIAQNLNEPLGTIKARIRRGMLKLRDSLQPFP